MKHLVHVKSNSRHQYTVVDITTGEASGWTSQPWTAEKLEKLITAPRKKNLQNLLPKFWVGANNPVFPMSEETFMDKFVKDRTGRELIDATYLNDWLTIHPEYLI